MQEKFDMKYEIVLTDAGVNANGVNKYYYTLNKRVGTFGYQPAFNSMKGMLKDSKILINIYQ